MRGVCSRVLVVDPDEVVRNLFEKHLKQIGCDVAVAADGRAGLELFCRLRPEVVIVEVDLPDLVRQEVVRRIVSADEEPVVLVTTGGPSVDAALEALKLGALAYFVKPVNFDHAGMVIRWALDERQLRRRLRDQSARRDSCGELVGSSPKMNEVYRQIQVLAQSDMTVLIQGETGTGKELAARAIHRLSPRRDQPLIPVNCGSVPETLLESELFGYMKGAFTGAGEDRPGLFSAAEHGTIFLDEIELAPPAVQAALLRVLDRKEIQPVGGRRPIKLDVRILVATNKDLESLVAEGVFREDLFYRIIEATITMPPLHERPEDIPLLVERFLEEEQRSLRRVHRRFSPQCLNLLTAYHWPGNVRELRSLVKLLAATAPRPVIRPGDLPPRFREKSQERVVFKTLREMEREHVERALRRSGFNKAMAARLLGVSRATLYSLLKKHGIS